MNRTILWLLAFGLLALGGFYMLNSYIYNEKQGGGENIPVTTTPVKIYFYNPKLDEGPLGVECSSKGLVPVDRDLEKTTTLLKDSIELLLRGELLPKDKESGLTTEFPLSKVELKSARIENGVAILEFTDPENRTSGGSCRVSVLREQVVATAKQFAGVKEVRILPEELFQP